MTGKYNGKTIIDLPTVNRPLNYGLEGKSKQPQKRIRKKRSVPFQMKKLNRTIVLTVFVLIVTLGIVFGSIHLLLQQNEEATQPLLLQGTEQWALVSSTPVAPNKQLQNAVSGVRATQFIQIGGYDSNQFYPDQWSQGWVYSECSAHALLEVFWSYGKERDKIIGDVLNKEQDLGWWILKWGSLEDRNGRPAGMPLTAQAFGFKTIYFDPMPLNSDSLKTIKKWLTDGHPVILGFTLTDANGPVGHWLMVYEYENGYYRSFDSSRLGIDDLTDDQLLYGTTRKDASVKWNGWAFLIVPA